MHLHISLLCKPGEIWISHSSIRLPLQTATGLFCFGGLCILQWTKLEKRVRSVNKSFPPKKSFLIFWLLTDISVPSESPWLLMCLTQKFPVTSGALQALGHNTGKIKVFPPVSNVMCVHGGTWKSLAVVTRQSILCCPLLIPYIQEVRVTFWLLTFLKQTKDIIHML